MKCFSLWLCLLLACCPARAGLLDALHVRAKADAPKEADQPGYRVSLFDFHGENNLVNGTAAVPESFGKVDVAAFAIVDPEGRRIAEVALASEETKRKETWIDFQLKREYLKNSTLTLGHNTAETFDVAIVHLGTFEVQDHQPKTPPPPPRPVRVALVEQGVYGESEDEFAVTDTVSYEEGCRFGVRLFLRGDGRSVPMRVEQTLPAPPKTWGDDEARARLTISPDGRTSSETRMVPTNELLHPGWSIAEGDPEGDYQTKIYVRDDWVKTFVFHVRREAAPAGTPAP